MKMVNYFKHPINFLKLISLVFLLSSGSLLNAQQNPQGSVDQQQADIAGPAIIFTVLRGSPDKGGGETQQYQINSGQTVFVKIDQKDQNEKVDLAYEAQVNQISNEISNKITDIQVKQKEISEEIYPAFVAPIDLDKQSMQSELENLRDQRDKMESDQKAKQASKNMQTGTVKPPRPKIAAGLNIQPNIENGGVSFDIKPKGLKGNNTTETNIQAPLGKWVKVLGKEDTDGTEIWIKAEIAK